MSTTRRTCGGRARTTSAGDDTASPISTTRALLVSATVATLVAVGLVTGVGTAAAGGEFVSVTSFGGTGADTGSGVAVDAAGNRYTIGSFVGTVDFDPGPGVANRTSSGASDVFVTKLDPDGLLLWAATFGGTGADTGSGVAVDADGNVVATGSFEGTIDIDPGAGTDNRTSSGASDVFVTELDPDGLLLWAATFGGTGVDQGQRVAVGADGNVHTIGRFAATVDFDPGAGTANRTSNGGTDVFVTKLDPDGLLKWAATFGGTSAEQGLGVAVDAAGNVHTTGRFGGTVDFDPDAGTANRTSVGGSFDVFVSKLSTDGNHLWAATFGGGFVDQGLGIDVDAQGDVYTTGSFALTADFDPGAGVANRTSSGADDVFVTKLDADGTFVWVATALGIGITGNDRGTDVALGASEVHTTGFFEGRVQFDPISGTTRESNGATDVFVWDLAAKGLCGSLTVTVDLSLGDTPTAGADVILGTPDPDVIDALGGDDVVCGGGGKDTITGGPGNDTIFGDAGDDTTSGGAGNDDIDAGDGDDTVFGGDGNDDLFGSVGVDTIQGNAGDDTISGFDGDDILSGNDGDDTIRGGLGNDTIFGVAGADTIRGGFGDDTILGGLGNDTIEGDDSVFGGAGNDLISGNAGNDQISGNDGNDTLYGVDGNDTIAGNDGIDTIQGGLGTDTIDGGGGNDAISGNQDNDTIGGGSGDDEIYGVDGNDTLNGGTGIDTILGGNNDDVVNGGDDGDLLSGNAGFDAVNGDAGDDEIYGADGNDTLTGGGGIDIILGGNNNDTINSTDGVADQVSGNAGTDTCIRDPGIDAVFACETQLP